MLVLGPIGFLTPWLLWGLVVLPVLWVLLRAVPPAPIIRRFPGIALLLGLTDRESEADKTPWWLLLLRLLAVAALILGFAGPVLNPDPPQASQGSGPLLILTDGSWPEARDWTARTERITRALADATTAGRPVALVSLTDTQPGPLVFSAPDTVAATMPGLAPQAWRAGPPDVDRLIAALPPRLDTLWLSDGLAGDPRDRLLAALSSRGSVRVFESGRPVLALGPGGFADGKVNIPVLRAGTAGETQVEVSARGLDPAGAETELARTTVALPNGQDRAEATFDLPPELRNRLTRFEITGEGTAGAVSLTDDALKRRKVAIVSASSTAEGLELLSPDHYLRQALEPSSDLMAGTITDVLQASPDVIILADIAKIPETDALQEWVEEGGLLVRFAGPRLAASDDGRDSPDPLLPVRLRMGGRSIGGAMSWGEPKTLAPFPEGTAFAGLAIPADVTVRSQVMAEPDPDLADATIAALADGTPLVTEKRLGQGRVVLFHVTANAEWSTLPLSGLFVQMMERLAVSAGGARATPQDLKGTTWTVERVLTGDGRLEDAGDRPGVPGEVLARAQPGPDLRPGLYSDDDRRMAVNAVAPDETLRPATWPASVIREAATDSRATDLKGWVLLAALLALMLDILGSLWVGGRLGSIRRGGVQAGIVALALMLHPAETRAADEAALLKAANNVVLAYVETGNPEVDRISRAGMAGLSQVLFARTSVEPGDPLPVDVERDDLAVFTFLYWPVTADQTLPTPQAYARLNRYLRTGGMILFDTRDGDVSGMGSATPEAERLRVLAAPLDIPPLEPVPADHVLTRSFYLIQDFPGRYLGAPVWAEAAPPDAVKAEGMPFRNLNDGVTPVLIGGNDWAAAWAVDEAGRPMFPVGRGEAGERQREMAYRFGVNLIMHVLTGNYKSDQVHVPALLERLGQ